MEPSTVAVASIERKASTAPHERQASEGGKEDRDVGIAFMDDEAPRQEAHGDEHRSPAKRPGRIDRDVGPPRDRGDHAEVYEREEGTVGVPQGEHQAARVLARIQVPADLERVQTLEQQAQAREDEQAPPTPTEVKGEEAESDIVGHGARRLESILQGCRSLVCTPSKRPSFMPAASGCS